uniref:uncharacterized protein LOC120348527 n=1 Tax=Styela clava TaxID=7725 RepID=UPI00193AC4B5|nr:uncharacterized protein LOC120348527 [Styela clava]
MVQVENNRNAIMNGQLGNISSDDESDDTYNAYKYVRMKNGNNSTNHDDYHNNVMIHPPIYEVTQKTLSVTLPDDESNEPAQNYLSAVHWNLFLIPLVSATWACGILSINFRLVPLIYTFCVLNVLQAIYIFAYYCVVTFRLRHKWFVMTSHEYNQNARPVTVWLGNDPGDDYDVINGRRMGRKRRKKRKIPNIDLMTRTPTPFQSAPPIELLERQTQHSTNSQPRSSRPKSNSVSKSVDSKLPWISKSNNGKPMLNRLHTSVPALTSFCDVVTGDMAENKIPVTRNANRYSIRKYVHKLETDSNRTSQSKTQYEVAVSQSDSTLVIRGESQRSSYASLKNEQIFGQVMPVSSSRQTKLPGLPGNPNLEEKDELSDSQSFASDFDDILRSLDPRAGESYILPDKNTRSAKIPFVKSVSDGNVLTRSHVLKSRNSLPCSPEKQESKLDLSEIISNEPFSASTSRESPDKQTDNSYSRTSSGQGSDKALLSTTPPMRIDDGDENTLPDIKQNERLSNETTVLASIHPRKTYDLEPESGNSSSTEPCTPLPRKQSQKFSPIPMPDLTMKNSLLKNKKSR